MTKECKWCLNTMPLYTCIFFCNGKTNYQKIINGYCVKVSPGIQGHSIMLQGHGHIDPVSQGPVSISDKTSYRKMTWSLEAARFVFRIVRSLWNLIGTSAALLPMCISNFKAMRYFKLSVSRLWDFTRSYDNTSYRILKRGHDSFAVLLHIIVSRFHVPNGFAY